MERLERYAVYLITLVLAITVFFLTLGESGGEEADCADCEEEFKPHFEAIGRALGDLNSRLTGLEESVAANVTARVGALISAHGEETTTALSGLNTAVGQTIGDRLADLEERVADAVAAKLLAAGCTVTGTGKCPDCPAAPCPELPPEVKSRHTFLYENARLNEEGEVTADSVGVKLAGRHLKRLALLTNALRPCHRPDAPVVFEVTGFSSTAEFRAQPGGEALSNSDALNLKTANLRRQLVSDYLESQGFHVVSIKWLSEREMQRPYRDEDPQSVAQQALNRTVFVDIKSAGACDLGDLGR